MRLLQMLGATLSLAASAWAADGVDVGKPSAWRNLVPAQQIERAAAGDYDQLKRAAAAKHALAPDDHRQVRRLRTIAQRLIPFAARAGFDPHAGVTLWRKMTAANRGAPPQWLSTHPSGNNRIREIERHLPEVVPLYEQARK